MVMQGIKNNQQTKENDNHYNPHTKSLQPDSAKQLQLSKIPLQPLLHTLDTKTKT